MAGPISNVIMSVILAIIAVALARPVPPLSEFALRGVYLSLYLAIFNMIPVPPLDGSKLLLAARIPMAVYVELSRFGFMLLVVAMSVTNIGTWMSEWSAVGARAILSVFT